MDLVNFEVGTKTVSLEILNILLTEQYNKNLTEVPNLNPNFLGVKEFMNVPVPVFDLGRILNRASTESKNADTIAKIREQQTLFYQWLDFLNQNSSNKNSSQSANDRFITDFDKWINNLSGSDEDLTSLLHRVTAHLSDLYASFLEVKASVREGVDESSLSTWNSSQKSVTSRIDSLFDSAIEQVSYGYKPIIVFTTINGRDPHVGLLVDKVQDSLTVKEEDIKGLDSVTGIGFDLDQETKAMLTGLVTIDEKHSLIIDPSALFSSGSELDTNNKVATA